MCYREVLVEVRDGAGGSRLYGDVTPEKVSRIVAEEVLEGRAIDEWLVSGEGKELGFFDRQVRIVLRNCGKIDPGSVEEYIASGGYQAIAKVLDG